MMCGQEEDIPTMRQLFGAEYASAVWRYTARRGAACGAAALMLAASMPGRAAEHVVPRQQLHASVAASQKEVRENRAEILRTLGSEQARTALTSAGIEFSKVEQAVASLDEETAARLAERAREANREFAAGSFSNQTLTYVVIALAAAVIVLIAVT